MHYWVLFSLLIVVIVKYYTATEMRRLERRLETVKEELQRAKARLQEAQNGLDGANAQEELFVERVRKIKETIEDLQVRLTARYEADADGVLVSDSAPPSSF